MHVATLQVDETTAPAINKRIRNVSTGDTMDRYYELGDKIGQGAFGEVFIGHHRATGELETYGDPQAVSLMLTAWCTESTSAEVASHYSHPLSSLLQRALKRVRAVFDDWRAAVSMRDVQSMLRVTQHPSIVTLYEIHRTSCGDVWFVFEHMETTLQDVVYYSGPLSRSVVVKWMRELLLAMDHLHQAGYIHRDLKGDNLLISADGTLKLSDFSLARGYHEAEHVMTSYISARWFRAPEVLLGLPYGPPMDVFASGCIFAEMHTKQPLFPAESQIDLLFRFIKVLGPSPQMVHFLTSRGLDVPATTTSAIENLRQVTNMPSDALELLAGLLHVDPQHRWTVDRALQHVFFHPVQSPFSCVLTCTANTAMSVTVTPDCAKETNLRPNHTPSSSQSS